MEEFEARSDGSFRATESAEAEGSGDVRCATTVTVAAPADMAGTAIFQVLRTILGPRWGSTETLVRWWRQRMGSPGPTWAASMGIRFVS